MGPPIGNRAQTTTGIREGHNIDSKFFWDHLLDLIDDENIIPIVGPGLLKVDPQGRDLPLYRLLAEDLANHFEVNAQELPPGDELSTVAYRCLAKGHQVDELYPALNGILKSFDQLEIPRPLLQLAEIQPFRLFITTTFDPLLVRALNLVRFGGRPETQVLAYSPRDFEDLPRELANLERPVVYHLFGKASSTPHSYVVTQEDLLEFFHSLRAQTSKQPNLLFDELNRRSWLVAGSSFGGWLARFFLRTPRRQSLRDTPTSATFLAESEEVRGDESLELFLQHFSRYTRFLRPGDAADLIAELHHRFMARHPVTPKPAMAGRSPSSGGIDEGAVFLSYASEDHEAAARIKDSLEAAGIAVYFDKTLLKAGDSFEGKLLRAIRKCSLFLPVLSHNTLVGPLRRFFKLEWFEALSEARKAAEVATFLVPVAIDDLLPDEEEIPERFRNVQWEKAIGGELRPEFIERVKHLFRQYHKAKAGAE